MLPRILLFISFIFSSQGLHDRLTKREIQNVFGVEDKSQVPEYHIIRTEKEKSEDGNLRIKFSAWNDQYELELKPNHRLVSPFVKTVIRDGNATKEFEGIPNNIKHNCHFMGKVISHGNASVAISDCSHLMGTLHLQEHFLVLQTIPKRARRHAEGSHLVFKRSASLLTEFERTIEEEVISLNENSDSFCDTSDSLDDPMSAEILSINYTIPSSAQLDSPIIFPNMDPITLEIGLFLDSKLYEHFKREYILDAEQHLTDFSLALINNVHVLYQQPTLSPNLEIVVVRFEMWKSQPSNLETYVHKGGQAQSLLDAFCRHQSHINPGTDLTDSGHWDHGVLLTGYDIYHTTSSVAGVAPVARMCDPLFACSLVEGLHLGRSFVLAHEMGHNMGMVHDGVQNQCSRSCCLMSAVNGAGKTTWSECSVREFNAFLMQLDESGRGNCLRDASPGLIEHNHLNDGRLPGQRFTANQQCSYFWGREYQVEIPAGRLMDDICRILWCGNGGSTISTAHPALEGSYCGNNKWCHEGQCSAWTQSSSAPSVVNGGWSDWSSEAMCPIQQCHIKGAITIKAQHRDCVNPAPNNGGHLCEGSSIRGVVCGSHQSTCKHGLTREEFSNRVCSSIKYDPNKPDRQLTGAGFEHSTQPCRVWCHLIDSDLIRNKGQFPDGSPCGEGQFCVSGLCLPVGCHDKALIETEDDCPFENTQLSTWNEWSPWSECSVSCGSGGKQQRKRTCFDPVGIRKCKGKSDESRPCSPVPSECDEMSEWGEWTKCSVNCGEGRETRKRICIKGICRDKPMREHRACYKPGCWSDWGSWSDCSESCGGGHQKRERECNSDECDGLPFEIQQCNIEPCSSASVWGDWLPCSVSCGIGFQIRERLCDGVLCPTANKQARTCNEQSCSVSAGPSDIFIWDEWSDWTECSAHCGEGTQKKERNCKRGSCPEWDTVRSRRCVLRPCLSWDEWSEWTACESCSQEETRKRSRRCENLDVNSCDGPSLEEETCAHWCSADNFVPTRRREIQLQTGRGRKVVVHGGRILSVESRRYSDWHEWSQCSASCGGGTKRRTRLCIGEQCPSPPIDIQKEPCNEQKCDDGYWSSWSDWTPCSITCGTTGTQKRKRKCNAFFIFQCFGSTSQSRQCEDQPHCETSVAVIRMEYPSWSDWSSWSACSCYTSTETRRRYCRITDPAIQGFCSGPILEQRDCKATSCTSSPGGWSDWSGWSQCSKDCQSTGHQIRNRMCSEPIPANRGPYCVGYSFDQRPCNTDKPCSLLPAVNGGWTEWTDWSECSHPCNNGHKSRTRFCSNPRPSGSGQPCFGSDFELQPCSEPSKCIHSLDGDWSSWSGWSDCPADCGFSVQSRYRSCSSPRPFLAGYKCHGVALQTSICNTDFCDESIDGEWSAWNEWSSCFGNCGTGTRHRVRACVSPPAQKGGAPCFGRSSEVEECITEDSFCSRSVQHSINLDAQVTVHLST